MVTEPTVFLFTVIASTYTFYIVLGVLAAIAWQRGKVRIAMAIAVTALGCGLSVLGLKALFAVPRPPDPRIAIDGYAFPSGHATGIVFLAFVLWNYARYVWPQKISGSFGFILLLLVILVGGSRIWFQVHTVEQVMAGYVLGAIWGVGLWWYLDRFTTSGKRSGERRTPPNRSVV